MCGRFTSTFEFSDIRVRWNLDRDLPKYTQRFNVAPETSPDILVIIRQGNNECRFMHWGLIPHWAADPSIALSINGAKLSVCPPPVQGDACSVNEQFDIAEMSLSWYVMARCRGEPLIALPVFPLRMFIQPYLFCRNPEEIPGSEKLKGRTIGIQQYRITVGLWARGILHERHGIHHSEVRWVTCEPESAGYRIPPNVKVELQNEDVETLLLKGKLDAVILPHTAKLFRAGDPRIHRVFADCRNSIRNYFQGTGIFPITYSTSERSLSTHGYAKNW